MFLHDISDIIEGMERLSRPHTHEVPELLTWPMSRVECVLSLENMRMTTYALMEVGMKGSSENGEITCNPGGESMNIRYLGDFSGEMQRGEVVFIRFTTWYRSERATDTVYYAPWEVRLVSKSFGDWLVRWGVAVVISEDEASKENDFQRRYVRGTWMDETIDLEDEKSLAVENICGDRTWRAIPILNAIKERGCDGLRELVDRQDWSAVVDLLSTLVPTADTLDPIRPLAAVNGCMGSFVFDTSASRTCIGGPLHDKIHDNRFTSGAPYEYEDTDINAPDGTLFMQTWTHNSLNTPDKRSAAFGDWYTKIAQEAA